MSSNIPKNEKKFFDALNDIFIGAKIEGKGGYINLMNIKSKYYKEHIYGAIFNYIGERFNSNNSNREELFARLYTFFNRYFNETGSIYFQYTPLKENVYERVYSNKDDVSLFYKTHMLYYVKSERVFNSMDLKVEDEDNYQDFHFNFDVSQLELAKNNEKKEIIFEFEKIENRKIYLNVLYSSSGKKTKLDEILKKAKELNLNESLLNKALQAYKKQAEVDFFINKDAKKFLKEQFNLWYYQYVFGDGNNGDFNISDFDDRRIRELQWTKEIAYKIIDFISQFEDELVKVWNKPKFVRNSNYVLTLDKLENNIDLIDKIISHKNFKEQENEWKELGYNLENYSKEKIISLNSLNEDFKYLTIDTKYFEDIKYDILNIFDNLDDELNGVLVNSDNYQALNTLQNKYKGKIQCIYIDPPFNTNSSPIIYKNNYKHSSWLSFIENRLSISLKLLKNNGINITAIDDVELRNLTLLQDNVFGIENYITTITTEANPQGRVSDKVSKTTEFNIIHCKNINEIGTLNVIKNGNKKPVSLKRTGTNSKREERPNRYYPILIKDGKIKMISIDEYNNIYNKDNKTFDDKFIDKIKNKYEKEGYFFLLPTKEDGTKLVWQRTFDRVAKEKDTYIIKNNMVYTPSFDYEIPKTLWKDAIFSNPEYGSEYLTNILGHNDFETPKSFHTIKQFLSMFDNSGIYLDYFGGSGTTAEAVIQMNLDDEGERKYITIELGNHFNTVLIPRIKKIIHSKKWKEGKALDKIGNTQFFKYYKLEQYEETLNKISYGKDTIFIEEENKDIFSNYVFLKDEKFTKAIELDLENGKTKIDLTKIYDDIDIGETLSNITGKNIKKISKNSVILEDIGEIKYNNIPLELVKPLIWWK